MAVSRSVSAVPLATKNPLPSVGVYKTSLCLLLLTVQTSTLILLMRHSLHGARYISATVVVTVEVAKLTLSLLAEFGMQLRHRIQRGPHHGRLNIFTVLTQDFDAHRSQVLQLSVPAALYAIQNNLNYFALSRLSAVTFQVVQQLKILTTAMIAVWMLGKRLKPLHWLSLCLLSIGVVIVQVAGINDDRSSNNRSSSVAKQEAWLGFIAVLLNSLSSGFAGIYFEKLVKSQQRKVLIPNSSLPSMDYRLSERPRSVWIQSMELGLFGLFFSVILAFSGESAGRIRTEGFFHGYDAMTWIVVLMQAVGGMLVALVVRYADSILKAFATSASIVLSAVVTFGLMGSELSWTFVAGTTLVIVAVCIYTLADRQLVHVQKTR